MEQRKFQRFYANSIVTFSNGTVQGEGYLTNLSLGGAAVNSNCPIAQGTYVSMRIASTESSEIQVDLAPVRWVKEGSFGVEFIRMEPESQRQLKRYLDVLGKSSEAA